MKSKIDKNERENLIHFEANDIASGITRDDVKEIYDKKKKGDFFKTPRLLVFGFLVLILFATVLLKSGIFLKPNVSLKTIDAFFISTSAVCITGLTTRVISETFNEFGYFFLICLVQVGAIGFITFVCLLIELLGKKLSLKNRLAFEESYDFSTSNIKGLISKIICFIFTTEGIGAILIMIDFIPKMGIRKGIIYSAFHSISAFCNAGFDLFNGTSLISFDNDVYLNIVMMLLIFLGSIGYLVIFDIIRKIRLTREGNYSFKKLFSRFNINTKLILTVSLLLIVFGTIFIFVIESFNENTLMGTPLGYRALVSLFQSVAARTGGLATINIASFKDATKFIYVILMFIGGSPASTGGGIKNITFAILSLSAISMIKGRSSTTIFNRTINEETVRKAMVAFFLGISTVIIGTILLLTFEDCSFIEGLFEVVSAFSTTGASLGITASLSTFGKMVISLLMFMGRVGIITVLMSLSASEDNSYQIVYPDEKIIIG